MANRLKSMVELYRSGEILEVPYDLSDPLAEAGGRLSLAPQAVESRIAEGRLRAITVGGDLLVSVADLSNDWAR